MVTYPNQQGVVASLTSSVNGISRVRIARVRRRSRRIACRIAKKASVNPALLCTTPIHVVRPSSTEAQDRIASPSKLKGNVAKTSLHVWSKGGRLEVKTGQGDKANRRFTDY